MNDKTNATLVGCAIGDALGNPFEMKLSNYKPLQDWDGLFKAGGTFWQGEAGQYTDDTLMSIALSVSLLRCGEFNAEDVASEYLYWYNTGNTRGIGNTTAEAIENLKEGATWEESGVKRSNAAGNGSAMRVAPIGLMYRFDLVKLMESAIKDASITHNSLEPKVGSATVGLGIALLANGISHPYDLINEVIPLISASVVKDKLILAQQALDEDVEPEVALQTIGTSGYAPETVGAAFYILAKTKDFKEAVVMAVKAGGDTDTTAAVVGALAGTYYGLEGIPDEYKEQVENFELLASLDAELFSFEHEENYQ
jgi:ADP-ribosylglycohydrolase